VEQCYRQIYFTCLGIEKGLMCSEYSEFSELLRGFNDPSCHFKHVTMSNAAVSVTFGSILFKG
jgi:hypothetical protein